MKYIITYAITDKLLGNPFGHSFLLFSNVVNQKVEVVDNWGFYGVPSTSRNGLFSKLKIKIGLDIDLTGNHGILRHEELRFLDLGKGLYGVSFELTKEKFNILRQRCIKQEEQQNAAIKDYSQGIIGKSPKSTRIYPQEAYSRYIYALEKARAKDNNEQPRLKPFEVKLGWTMWGPTVSESYTCKSMTVDLLRGILKPKHIDRLTEFGKHPTIPRYSSHLETIFLNSSGPLRKHEKRSGETVYYRDFSDKNVKLHWTIPPQEIITLNSDTKKMLQISPSYLEDAKLLVGKLQQLEWLFINASLDDIYAPYRKYLIQHLRDSYLSFSQDIQIDTNDNKVGIEGFCLNLLNLPRNRKEKILYKKIESAKYLLNTLYMCMVDGYKLDTTLPCEISTSDTGKVTSEYADSECLVSHLHEKDQKKLCQIIGRTYIEPEYLPEEENEKPLSNFPICKIA